MDAFYNTNYAHPQAISFDNGNDNDDDNDKDISDFSISIYAV